MKRQLFTFSFLCLLALGTRAQNTLTLEDCLKIGIENNLSLQSKRKEIQKGNTASLRIEPNCCPKSMVLPTITTISIHPSPLPTVQRMASYNVTQTLQYNANFGLQLQIPLYNQTLYTTLSIAKTMDEMNRLSYGKAREDLILQISQMYYLGQVTAEQIILIKANITRLEELRDITQAFYDNGMAMEVDVKRVNINLRTSRCSTTTHKP